MRIIHTSDWHLGKRLMGESLQDAHEKFLSWLGDEVTAEIKPDLIVVAGDIYDRAVPSTESIELFEDILSKFNKLNIPVLVTAGNHDSRVRLGTNTRFMENNGLHFRTRIEQITKPIIIPGEDFDLLAYGIPYLEPDVDTGEGPLKFATEPKQHDVLDEAVRRIKADIEGRVKKASRPIRTLIASHAWVTGSNPDDSIVSDSERNIKLGTIGWAGAGIFDKIDYVAMGHLHGHQVVKHKFDSDIRYSGSPIPYSFSEKFHKKQIIVADITKDGTQSKTFEPIEIPQIRGIQELKGSVDDFLSDKFSSSNDWIKIVITDRDLGSGVFDTLKRKFPHLLEIIPERINDASQSRNVNTAVLHQLTPEEVTRRFVTQVTTEKISTEVEEAIDTCCGEIHKELSQVNK